MFMYMCQPLEFLHQVPSPLAWHPLGRTETFVSMCKTLRVLNAVRDYRVGLPLTFQQYVRLTPRVLVDRLIARHHHLLAYRISTYVDLPHDRVLVHWACAKVHCTGVVVVQRRELLRGVFMLVVKLRATPVYDSSVVPTPTPLSHPSSPFS